MLPFQEQIDAPAPALTLTEQNHDDVAVATIQLASDEQSRVTTRSNGCTNSNTATTIRMEIVTDGDDHDTLLNSTDKVVTNDETIIVQQPLPNSLSFMAHENKRLRLDFADIDNGATKRATVRLVGDDPFGTATTDSGSIPTPTKPAAVLDNDIYDQRRASGMPNELKGSGDNDDGTHRSNCLNKGSRIIIGNSSSNNNDQAANTPILSGSSNGPSLSLAPSVEAYLQQCSKREDETTAGTSSPLGMKYIPRPEWCDIVTQTMRVELENMLTPFSIFDLTHVLDISFKNYDKSLMKCATYDMNGLERQFDVDSDDEEEDDSDDEEEDDSDDEEEDDSSSSSNESIGGESDEMINAESNIRGNNNYLKNDNQERVDFLKTQLTSNIIYFDITEYIWKTQRIRRGSHCSIPASRVDLDNTIVSPLPDAKLQWTYEELIGLRCRTAPKVGENGKTILHRAIEEHATDVAMDIIRIEYNTFLDRRRRCNELNTGKVYGCTLLDLTDTLLEKKTDGGCRPLDIAAQTCNIKIVGELLRCGVWFSAYGVPGSIIRHAAHFGHVEVIEYIIEFYQSHSGTNSLENHWPKTLVGVLDKADSNHTTPLMRAAQEGHISVVELLLKHEVSVNAVNKKRNDSNYVCSATWTSTNLPITNRKFCRYRYEIL